MHAELLDREFFNSLNQPMVLVERWRRPYNAGRPLSTLNYQPLALEPPCRPRLIMPTLRSDTSNRAGLGMGRSPHNPWTRDQGQITYMNSQPR